MYSLSTDLSCSDFSFHQHINRQLLMQFFYINHKKCLSKKILYQYFVVSLPCLGQLLLWKHLICNYIALSKNTMVRATKCSSKTAEVLLGADGYELTWVWYLSRCRNYKWFQKPQNSLCLHFFKKSFFWYPVWNSPCLT